MDDCNGFGVMVVAIVAVAAAAAVTVAAGVPRKAAGILPILIGTEGLLGIKFA